MMMLVMMTACVTTWGLVARMLGKARPLLVDALCGVQGGGWMPSAGFATRTVPPSRALTRA